MSVWGTGEEWFGLHGSGIVSNADDVLGMKGDGGVCEMCKCLKGIEFGL